MSWARIKAARGSSQHFLRLRDRAPPARRFAGKPAPTFVSGQSILCLARATALLVRRDIDIGTKAFARKSHRHNWPETNVGAGLPAKRRAGGARSRRRRMCRGGHLAALGLTGAECVEADTWRRSISQAQNVSRRTPGGARSRRRRMCRGGHLAALGLTGAECVEADTWRRSVSQAQNVSRRTPGGARSHRR